MLLYGSTDSGHSYKVRLFLLLASTPHRYERIDLGLPRGERPSTFRSASQFGEVPVLVDGGRAHCQSNAILMHLAGKTGQMGGTASERASVIEWLCWEANRVGFSVPNLRYACMWAPQPAEVMAYLHARASADLATLDAFLDGRQFLVASGLTIADLSCSAYLHWLDQARLSAVDHPNVARWLDRIRELPGWQHPDRAMRDDSTTADAGTGPGNPARERT
ncbi:glutathione S-transferase family protein [Methylibium sp.]|uniref:glutathione S-transferase family protein n=1 Tax=Methylibium sp. TaxID=2067992 RepID=UPI003D0A2D52